MIGFYLLPFPVRGVPAPYLWVFYKWLTALSERAVFIVGEDYLRNAETFSRENRWELTPEALDVYGYHPPTAAQLADHEIRTLPAELFKILLAQYAGNPIQLFRALLTQRLHALEVALATALTSFPSLEAIVTWCNCPSLSAVAAARGVRVIHLEVGPLRAPLYRPTAYLDFSGVNGNTEAARRYQTVVATHREIDMDELRRFFLLRELPPKDPVGRIGLALQVEDDSNLVAFGNGFDNQAAAVYVRLRFGEEGPIAIRSHPGSIFRVRDSWFEADQSYDSLEFIQRCLRIVTINSSLGLEAMLLGTPLTALGDSSFAFILAAPDAKERAARLAYYLFAYLVPESMQFDVSYLRFRLSGPAESAIVARHITHYLPRTLFDASGRSVWDLIDIALVGRQ